MTTTAQAVLQSALARLRQHEALSREMAQASVEALMTGQASAEEMRAFLLGLREKGETVEELVGCAQAMRAHVVPFPVPERELKAAVDTCGTGGDAKDTMNVSTIAAFLIAAAGAPVIKHGNRAVSSRCGSADLLEALGINVAAEPAQMVECFTRTNFAFLFAPTYHPAMKQVAAVRKALGGRTIFNLLGPLTNPAGVKCQVVGVATKPLASLMAHALQVLEAEHAIIVHGEDGLDEVTTTTTTTITEVRRGDPQPQTSSFDAEQALGIRRARLDQFRGGDALTNAKLARQLLSSGADEALRPLQELILVNAAWGLMVSGMYAGELAQCFDVVRLALMSGAALNKLQDVQRCLPR